MKGVPAPGSLKPGDGRQKADTAGRLPHGSPQARGWARLYTSFRRSLEVWV